MFFPATPFQALGEITGTVTCLAACSEDIQIALTTEDGTRVRFPTTLQGDGTAAFRIKDLALEPFTVGVSKPTWCFTPKTFVVMVNPDHMSVNGEDTASLDFTQKGYSLKIVVRGHVQGGAGGGGEGKTIGNSDDGSGVRATRVPVPMPVVEVAYHRFDHFSLLTTKQRTAHANMLGCSSITFSVVETGVARRECQHQPQRTHGGGGGQGLQGKVTVR